MKGYIKTKKHNNILLCSVMKPPSFEKVLICFRLKSYFSATVSIPRTQHQIQMEMKSFMQNVCECCSAKIAFCQMDCALLALQMYSSTKLLIT